MILLVMTYDSRCLDACMNAQVHVCIIHTYDFMPVLLDYTFVYMHVYTSFCIYVY